MRLVVGAMAAAQGVLCASHAGDRAGEFLGGLGLVACAICLLIGFLTPFVSVLITVGVLAHALSWLPVTAGNLFDGNVASFELVVMAVAITLLGPGVFSLDARLFGRHEIVIPPAPRAPKS